LTKEQRFLDEIKTMMIKYQIGAVMVMGIFGKLEIVMISASPSMDEALKKANDAAIAEMQWKNPIEIVPPGSSVQ
jgi:hypothetical protein